MTSACSHLAVCAFWYKVSVIWNCRVRNRNHWKVSIAIFEPKLPNMRIDFHPEIQKLFWDHPYAGTKRLKDTAIICFKAPTQHELTKNEEYWRGLSQSMLCRQAIWSSRDVLKTRSSMEQRATETSIIFIRRLKMRFDLVLLFSSSLTIKDANNPELKSIRKFWRHFEGIGLQEAHKTLSKLLIIHGAPTAEFSSI